jgi:hypothetical protein
MTDEDIRRFFSKADEPEIEARRQGILRFLLQTSPEVKEELLEQGRLIARREVLRRVLACRRLALSAEEEARIEACTDAATLERWFDQAVTAASTAEALQ